MTFSDVLRSLQRPPRSRRWIIVPILIALAIQAVTGIPNPYYLASHSAPSIVTGLSRTVYSLPVDWQNLGHVPLFASLSATLTWSLHAWFAKRRWTLLTTTVLAGLFAVFNEAAQAWVPTRTVSGTDLLLNLLGVVLGMVVVLLLCRR